MKKFNSFLAAFFGFALLFSTLPLFAQTEIDTTQLLDNIVIKENRLQMPFKEASRSVEIITRQQIENAPARSLAELLSYANGIDIRQRGIGGAQADINVRGGTFDQTLVLLDGFPLADPQTGHHLLNLPLDAQNIERIEILKGTGARVYGQNAFAGVVNIVTRQPNTEGGANFGVQYEEFASLTLRAGVNVPMKKSPLRLSYTRQRSNGYRPNADHNIENFFAQSQINIFNKKLDVMAGHTERKFGGSGFYAGPASNRFAALPLDNTTDEYEEIMTTFAAAKMELGAENWQLTPRVYWRKNADDYYFVRNQPVFNSSTSKILGGELNFSYKSKLGTTGLGVNAQSTDFSSTRLGERTRDQWSVAAEHRFSFLDGTVDLTPGVMYINYSDFGGELFPGIDLGIKLTDETKLYATWGRTLRVPTYTDLYFTNAGNLPNPNLLPEFANNYELGAKYSRNGLRLAFAGFLRDGSNIIDRTKTADTLRWFPTNVSNLKVYGMELSGEVLPRSLGILSVDFPVKRAQFGVTYLPKVDYLTPSDVRLSRYAADMLRWQANFSADFAVAEKFIPTLNVRYFERYTLPKGFESAYKGFLTDVRLAWAEKKWRVFGQVNNLFNKKYTESNGITMPRRWFSVGFDVRL